MRLILGCGIKPEEGAVNLDIRELPGVQVVHDLNVFPYPFKDGEFDFVKAEDVIEHIPDAIQMVKECWRILKPGGVLWIRTNYAIYHESFIDPSHCHFFMPESFDYFDPDTYLGKYYGFYSDVHFKITDKREVNKGLEFTMEKI